MLKVILLILFIVSSVGSIFWWMKERGYAPLLALIGSLISILMWYLDNKKSSDTVDKIKYQTNNIIKENHNSPIANNIEQQNNYYNNDSIPKNKKENKTESQYNIGDIHGNDNTIIQGDNNKIDKRKITVSKLKPEITLAQVQANIPIQSKPSPVLEDGNYYLTKYRLLIKAKDTYNILKVNAKGEGVRYLDITITSAGMMSDVQIEHSPGEATCTISNPDRNEYFVLVYTTKPIDNFKNLIKLQLDKFEYNPIH